MILVGDTSANPRQADWMTLRSVRQRLCEAQQLLLHLRLDYPQCGDIHALIACADLALADLIDTGMEE
jgi:hypothetical protein